MSDGATWAEKIDRYIAVLSNLAGAVRPGGRVFVETLHRDRIVANPLQTPRPAIRLPDGILLLEEPRLGPIAGRVETTWYWSGLAGSGPKSGSIRAYPATEVARVVEAGAAAPLGAGWVLDRALRPSGNGRRGGASGFLPFANEIE